MARTWPLALPENARLLKLEGTQNEKNVVARGGDLCNRVGSFFRHLDTRNDGIQSPVCRIQPGESTA